MKNIYNSNGNLSVRKINKFYFIEVDVYTYNSDGKLLAQKFYREPVILDGQLVDVGNDANWSKIYQYNERGILTNYSYDNKSDGVIDSYVVYEFVGDEDVAKLVEW